MKRPAALLLDTNLLLLWLASLVDPALLLNYKRIQMFGADDIDQLRQIVGSYPSYVSTPQILSETDTFIDSAPSHRRGDLRRTLRFFTQSVLELYKPSSELTENAAFGMIGLSDTSLVHASQDALVVTTDGRLATVIWSQQGFAQLFDV